MLADKFFKIQRQGAITHIIVTATEISGDCFEALSYTLNECLQNNQTHIVLDCLSIRTFNSSTLELLLNYQEKCQSLGGELKLTQLSNICKTVLAITGLDMFYQSDEIIESDASELIETLKASPLKLGELLVINNLVTKNQVEEAIALQKVLSKRMGEIVIEKGWVKEEILFNLLAKQLRVPFLKLKPGYFDPEVVCLLDNKTVQRLNAVPLFKVRGVTTVATNDPASIPALDEIKHRLSTDIRVVLSTKDDILSVVESAFEHTDLITDLIEPSEEDLELIDNKGIEDCDAIDTLASASPVVNLVNSIIQKAVSSHASDVHIEPTASKCRVRFRIDGILYEIMNQRIELHPSIVSRLKVMANLDIAERRKPQDGRIQVSTHGRVIDLRFSSLPSLYGEKIVLRLLDTKQAILDINSLGMSNHNLSLYRELLGLSCGLVLVTGPTGSGKTTTLYSALSHLNSMEKNIVTIEDPIEYQLDIINQNQVKNAIDLTFSTLLKHVLRQDPDIIMVGEIRERETAEIAVQAALTGHLVFSTLHTNDSVSAITRLIDMGIEPYLLSSALSGVIGQRLVRKICPGCKTYSNATKEIITKYHWESQTQVKLFRGQGCPECYDSGYKGRLGIHEVLLNSRELQQLIISNPNRDMLDDFIQSTDMITLFRDGLTHVLDGQTTLEEINRVVSTI